jgi:hypothetical protein
MGATVKIEGLKELRTSLKAISKELPKELTKLNKAAAELVSPEAQSRAPVRSGRLRDAVKPGATQTGGFVKVSGLPYVGPIVGGWPKHNIKANPFLWNALDAKTDEVVDKYQDGIADLIDRYL